MKQLLILVALLAVCSPPPPKKYTKVEIGMPYMPDFSLLCPASFNVRTVTTEKGETKTVTNKRDDYQGNPPQPTECVGTFTFVDNKLVSIEH